MVKKLLLLAGLIGLVSVIVRRLLGAPSKSNWQPAYTPAPAPTPRATPTPEAAPAPAPEAEPEAPDDTAGSSPDEALSDAASGPHPDTTPDEPVEVVELADYTEPRKPDPLTDPLPPETAEADEPTPVGEAVADETPADAPYGPGSALAGPGGESPGPSFTIKGNKKSMLFHTTESPSYDRTIAQVWFTNEVAAEAAGFRHWKAGKQQQATDD